MPSRESVLEAIDQFSVEGEAFLEKFASGRKPKAHYLEYNDRCYPLKAIWSASHRPQIHNREFTTGDATRGLKGLGFTTVVRPGAEMQLYLEGELRRRETAYFARNPKLSNEAKAFYNYICQGCAFDFEKFYGPLGKGYIECHHIDPISKRGGRNEPRNIDDVTVLCANCHRMVHRERSEAMSLDTLRETINAAISNRDTTA